MGQEVHHDVKKYNSGHNALWLKFGEDKKVENQWNENITFPEMEPVIF